MRRLQERELVHNRSTEDLAVLRRTEDLVEEKTRESYRKEEPVGR